MGAMDIPTPNNAMLCTDQVIDTLSATVASMLEKIDDEKKGIKYVDADEFYNIFKDSKKGGVLRVNDSDVIVSGMNQSIPMSEDDRKELDDIKKKLREHAGNLGSRVKPLDESQADKVLRESEKKKHFCLLAKDDCVFFGIEDNTMMCSCAGGTRFVQKLTFWEVCPYKKLRTERGKPKWKALWFDFYDRIHADLKDGEAEEIFHKLIFSYFGEVVNEQNGM